MTACSKDPVADVARLEALLETVTDREQRVRVQSLLLGRYFTTKKADKARWLAQAVVERMDTAAEIDPATARFAANAAFNVGVYYFQVKQYDKAKEALQSFLERFGTVPYANQAAGYLRRIELEKAK